MNSEDAREPGKTLVIGTTHDSAIKAAIDAGQLAVVTNTETGAQRHATPEEIEGHYLSGVGAGGAIRPLSGAEKKRHARAEQRIVAGFDYDTAFSGGGRNKSFQARAASDSRYVTQAGEAFARRKFPKVKGKAAVKVAKRERQAARNRDQRALDIFNGDMF